MKCTKCDGESYDVSEPACGIKRMVCRHCDGTGEIPNNSWWLFSNGAVAKYVNTNVGWISKDIMRGHEILFEINKRHMPVCRMKMIK